MIFSIIQCICGAIYAMSSLLTLLWGNDYPAAITARLMAGIAHGIVYAILIAHAGEVSMPKYRGRVVASINFMLFLGCALFAICHYVNAKCHQDAFYITRLFSIIALFLSLLSILAAVCFTLESPTFLIRAGNDQKGLSNMIKVRNDTSETDEVRTDFQHMHSMVAEDFFVQTQNIYVDRNGGPLLMAVGCRLLGVIVNNWILNIIQIELVEEILVPTNSQLAPVILIVMRLLGSLISTIIIDIVSRRLLLEVSIGMTIVVTIISAVLLVAGSDSSKYVLLSLIIAHQIAVAGIDAIQHVLIAEAFGLKKKPWSICFVACSEYALHIIVIAIFYDIGAPDDVKYGVTFATAGVLVIIGSILHFSMPETRGITLRQAREAFRVATL